MKTFLIIILSLGLLSSCGYKVLDKSNLANFNIIEFNSTGDNKINFFIKNKLKNKITNSKEENEIIIDLQTVKTKNIKDKNINNQDNLEKFLAEKISEKILNKLIILINDL